MGKPNKQTAAFVKCVTHEVSRQFYLQIKLDVGVCKLMHTGRTNLNYPFILLSSKLSVTTQKKDQDIFVESSMKTSAEHTVEVKKSNKVQGVLGKG